MAHGLLEVQLIQLKCYLMLLLIGDPVVSFAFKIYELVVFWMAT